MTEGEIPDNNIDDDNNGYVDDIHGYDFVHNSGNVSSDTNGYHGNYISSILIGYNQKLGYKGLLNDYNVEVIILKVLNGEESIGNIRDIKRAIDYAEMVGAYDKDNLISLSGTSSATAIMTSKMAISSIYYDLEMSKIKDFICSNVRQVNNLSGKCRTS